MTDKSDLDLGQPITSLPSKDGKPDFRANHGCCRDLICLLFFLGCIIGVIVIFAVGFYEGDPFTLLTPVNTDSQYCGYKSEEYDTTTTPYLFRPNPVDDSLEICVNACPNSTHRCIHDDGTLHDEDATECLLLTDANYSAYNTINIVYRCFPDVFEEAQQFESYEQFRSLFITSVSDFKNGWWVFLVAGGCAIILAFMWVCLFQCCGLCIVWTCIVVALAVILGAGVWILVYGLTKYKELPAEQDKVSCYVLIGFGGGLILAFLILFLIIIALRSRISLAVKLIEEASRAIKSMCCIVVVPIAYIIIFLICTAMLVVTMVYYFSSLKRVIVGNSWKLEYTSNTRYVVIFVVLMFFWVTFFLVGMNQSTISGAGAEFYFSRGPADRPTFPIGRSLYILLLHHLGSVSFGSFLIALVCTFRAIVLYLQKKFKQMNSPHVKCLLNCIQCCLGCCQKVIEFIASRAYIMMMIHGKSFIPSAIDVSKLMLRNILRTSVLTGISKLIIFCGIAVVSVLSALICLLVMRPDFLNITSYSLTIYYWWFMALICFVIAFAIAYLILQVYDFLIDTIFICFLQDEEIAKSSGGTYTPYASPALRDHMSIVALRSEDKNNKSDVVRVAV